jgi:two-component system, LuxR family, sensor kinase FixL
MHEDSLSQTATGLELETQEDDEVHRPVLLIAGAVGIAAIALVDWKVHPNLSLGYLYFLPMLLIGLCARWPTIVLVAVTCALLREQLSPAPWEPGHLTGTFLGFLAFAGTGLFVSELARNRRRALRDTFVLTEQIRRRERAEEDLRLLVETSPAAIVVVSADGRVTLANEAATRLLASDGGLHGRSVTRFLPAMESVLDRAEPAYRTAMECVGRRADGEPFLAHIWFSTYRSASGNRLAAIIVDTSEDLRDREATGLEGMLNTSRIMVAAVSHEVKNLSAAAAVAHANLSRRPELSEDPDFAALRTCIDGLQRIASSELRLSANLAVARVDLATLLDELRVLIEPQFRDAGAVVRWDVEPRLSNVLGDHHSLLQIFLNLAQNSLQAMSRAPQKMLDIRAHAEDVGVRVAFRDTGPGVADPKDLFQPFHSTGGGTGLGLFVSRTLARYFGGDLCAEKSTAGGCFIVHLARATR